MIFVFIIYLKQVFLGTRKLVGNKRNVGGTAPKCPPSVATGLLNCTYSSLREEFIILMLERNLTKKIFPQARAGFLNRGPRSPSGASSAVILQNTNVTIIIIRQLKGEWGHKP